MLKRRYLALVSIIAVTSPIRIWIPVGPFASFSVLDIFLLAAASILLVTCRMRNTIRIGDGLILVCLSIPPLVTILSSLWSIDLTATLKSTLIFSEALVAYLVAVNIFSDLRPENIMKYLYFFIFMTLIASVFSLLGVPGFEPIIPPSLAADTSEAYRYLIRYYTRLSNPFLGASNNYATVLALFPIVFAAYGVYTNTKWPKIMAIICCVAIFFTLSRGVILSLFFVGIIYAVNTRSFVKSLPSLILISLILAGSLYVFLTVGERADDTITSRLSSKGIEDRLSLFALGWDQISRAPFLGYGGYVVVDKNSQTAVHNTFIQQIIYFGIPLGFVVGLSLIAMVFRFMNWTRGSNMGRYLANSVGFSIFVEILVFMSESSFEGSVLRVVFYFQIGIFTALLFSLREATISQGYAKNTEAGLLPIAQVPSIHK